MFSSNIVASCCIHEGGRVWGCVGREKGVERKGRKDAEDVV